MHATTRLLLLTLPDIHRFKKFFHCHTQVFFCILGAARPLQVFLESHVRGGGNGPLKSAYAKYVVSVNEN